MYTTKEDYKKFICSTCVMGHCEVCPDEKIEVSEDADIKIIKCQNFEKIGKSHFTLIRLLYDDGITELIQTDAPQGLLESFDQSEFLEVVGSISEWFIHELKLCDYIAIPEKDLKEWEKNPANYCYVKNIVMY